MSHPQVAIPLDSSRGLDGARQIRRRFAVFVTEQGRGTLDVTIRVQSVPRDGMFRLGSVAGLVSFGIARAGATRDCVDGNPAPPRFFLRWRRSTGWRGNVSSPRWHPGRYKIGKGAQPG